MIEPYTSSWQHSDGTTTTYHGHQFPAPCIIVFHNCLFGTSHHAAANAHWYDAPDAQHKHAVHIVWDEPKKPRQRKTRTASTTVTPNDVRWCEVVVDGNVIYDSRSTVPIDMVKFEASAKEWGHYHEYMDRLRAEVDAENVPVDS